MQIPLRPTPAWHAGYLALLPELERRIDFRIRQLAPAEREEARQAILAAAAMAYARLSERGLGALAYPGPLADYGWRHYRAGRLVGSPMNAADVGSRRWRRVWGRTSESLGDDDGSVAAPRSQRLTPADLGGLRVDFAAWLATLSDRDRQIVEQLARGEESRHVAQRVRLSAGRISQLRRELHASWQQFCGEAAAQA
ncbi:MAG: hypothetical protein CMJ58_27510 [Planctomycetaceae bacterium]|nr:hypothetical protein [Planctomycetaceae bacterium]